MKPTAHLPVGELSLDQLTELYRASAPISISPADRERLRACQHTVAGMASGDTPAYGINTGFGKLANQRISSTDLATLQLNLIRSHAVGVGEPLAPAVVRLMMILKVNALAQAYSGVSESCLDSLLAFINHGLTPYIPCQGSVGASGDLAPLAHMSLALIGEGELLQEGKKVAAAPILQQLGIPPLRLQAKEGLALINGTQTSTALALHALLSFEPVLESALIIGAMTVDAARGSDGPFDARIHALRRQRGQMAVAQIYRDLLKGSAIRNSHRDRDDRVQDPYSLRCQPQVMGACLDQLRHAALILTREANAVTDNPLIFNDSQEVLSGGNFHAEPVALACDAMAVAIAETGAIAERRIAMLIDHTVSGLPPFLTDAPGLNSGFMIAHVTAAALASENKSLAHPASVDSLPTSANQEDHVSMATFAARRLQGMISNVTHILAIEYLAAAQGICFQRPLTSAPTIEAAIDLLRTVCASTERDRYFAPDISKAAELVHNGSLASLIKSLPTPPKLWITE
ncbi:MAG: histidine ammonia-lyase [Pseudomonadota bacterium]